jgi:glucose-6-phosphate-specific signal transduction histidine kinase
MGLAAMPSDVLLLCLVHFLAGVLLQKRNQKCIRRVMRNYERRLATELRRGQFLEMTILKLKEEIRNSKEEE